MLIFEELPLIERLLAMLQQSIHYVQVAVLHLVFEGVFVGDMVYGWPGVLLSLLDLLLLRELPLGDCLFVLVVESLVYRPLPVLEALDYLLGFLVNDRSHNLIVNFFRPF